MHDCIRLCLKCTIRTSWCQFIGHESILRLAKGGACRRRVSNDRTRAQLNHIGASLCPGDGLGSDFRWLSLIFRGHSWAYFLCRRVLLGGLNLMVYLSLMRRRSQLLRQLKISDNLPLIRAGSGSSGLLGLRWRRTCWRGLLRLSLLAY